MTFRSIILGLVLGMLLAALSYLNEWGLHLAPLAHNLTMPGVLGLMLLGLLGLNPLLRVLRLRPLQRGEWATLVSLMMVASVISGPALMWQFSEIVLLPQKQNHDSPEWRSKGLLDYAPPGMLVSPGGQYEETVEGFVRGRAGDDYGSLLHIVPWQAWKGTLAFWMPLVALVFLGVTCLAVVVHPQWANNERLTYPVATLTGELLEGPSEGGIFRQKLFWLGAGLVLAILAVNAACIWASGRPEDALIPLEFSFRSVMERFPALGGVPRMGTLLAPRIFFVGLALAFLVNNDVAFSVGISHILYAVVVLLTAHIGLPWGWAVLESPFWSSMVMGSYVGMAIMLLYAGRFYYWNVLRRAFGFSAREDVTVATAWACRAGLLCAAGGVFLLTTVGRLPLPAAILFVLSLALLFLVMTRVHVETGVFVLQPAWWPLGVAIGIFGLAALGPKAVLILAILSAVFAIDPRVAMMPVVSNVLRLGQIEGIRPGRMAGWIAPTIVLALLIGVPAVLITQYYFGQSGHFFWAPTVSQYSFNLLVRELGNFGVKATPELGFRAGMIAPSGQFLIWALVGLGLVVSTAVLRLRLTWWPIHPVLFLIWCSDTMRPLAASFLLGWMIKQVVMKFGGGNAFVRFRNLFIGLAAGEFLAGIIWAIIGMSYYMSTGKNVPEFKISPF
ncbi:MAG: hypothetical protein LLG01_04475 [Planctomycetaceae bacterium]|nr:hypothetical protein [Planctomycetaceae bacterium]